MRHFCFSLPGIKDVEGSDMFLHCHFFCHGLDKKASWRPTLLSVRALTSVLWLQVQKLQFSFYSGCFPTWSWDFNIWELGPTKKMSKTSALRICLCFTYCIATNVTRLLFTSFQAGGERCYCDQQLINCWCTWFWPRYLSPLKAVSHWQLAVKFISLTRDFVLTCFNSRDILGIFAW